jgi:caffeoyl-CoA O-methyltransferase
MSDFRSLPVTAELIDYAVGHGSSPVDEVLADLRDETAALGRVAGMQVGPDQGQLLTLLTGLVGARRAVEGARSPATRRPASPGAWPTGGTLLCCDVNEDWTALARKAWDRAGLADRIELRIAPALDTLRALPATADIDLVFIDADKPGYVDYWDELVPRVRPGGLLLVDNVLWSGAITDPAVDDANTVALRAFNDRVAADDRVEAVVLPAFDGSRLPGGGDRSLASAPWPTRPAPSCSTPGARSAARRATSSTSGVSTPTWSTTSTTRRAATRSCASTACSAWTTPAG